MCGGLFAQLNPVTRKDVNLNISHLFGQEEFPLPKLIIVILSSLQKRKSARANQDLFSFCVSLCFRKLPAPFFWRVGLKKKKASQGGTFCKAAIQSTFLRRLDLSTLNILTNLSGLARPIFDHLTINCPSEPKNPEISMP